METFLPPSGPSFRLAALIRVVSDISDFSVLTFGLVLFQRSHVYVSTLRIL